MATFAAVADAGSFTGAAQRLRLPRSAISRMVAELEDELGISLLSRTTRRIALTEPGAAYYQACARMVAEAMSATAAVRGHRAEPTGRLRITTAIGLAPPVAAVVAEMAGAFPQLSFDLRLEDRYADLLADDIDVAVRGGLLDDSGMMVRKLAPVLYVVCASPAYLQQHGVPRGPRALANHAWIMHDNGPRKLTARRRGRTVTVTLRSRMQVNSGVAVTELLRADQGLALAPLWEVAELLRAGVLRVVLGGWQFKSSAVYAISPAGRHRLPKVAEFTSRIARRLATVGWGRMDSD